MRCTSLSFLFPIVMACGGAEAPPGGGPPPGDNTATADLESLKQAACEWAQRCECWPPDLRQSCDSWLGEDLGWLQERAAEQGWTLDEACIRREIELYQELGCSAELSVAERYALELDVRCVYYEGSVAPGGPCTSAFDCAGDAYCDDELDVCQEYTAAGAEGQACILGAACDGNGALWCDRSAGAEGTCKPALEPGEDCSLGPAADTYTTAFCEEGSYCDASSRRCEAAPGDGEPCAQALSLSPATCAPGHLCALDTGTPTCVRLPVAGEGCTRFCADGSLCISQSDEGACAGRSDCRCVAGQPWGTALTCSFTDDERSRTRQREPLPFSRRELVRLLRRMR